MRKSQSLQQLTRNSQAEHTNIASDLMTIGEAAKYLRLGERTMYRMKGEGTGPQWVKLAGRAFYRKSDLDAWIDSQIQGGRDE